MDKIENRNIYVIGHAGNQGTTSIIKYIEKNNINTKFTKSFLNKYKKPIETEIRLMKKNIFDMEKYFCTSHVKEITKGGIFTSLWGMSKKENVGMDFSQRDIPIYQITFEICNALDLNPYRLYTKNAYLIFETEKWYEGFKRRSNISIKKIGKLYNKKECARIDGETKAYLTKDYKDEIDRVIKDFTKHELV